MKEITCCFTGHRSIPDDKLSTIKESLEKEIVSLVEKGYTNFVAGGALGFDTLAAKTVLALKQSYPQIKLHLVLPCKDQDKLWKLTQKLEYNRILKKADSLEYVQPSYTRFCMFERNRKMVDMSSAVIAFFDGNDKGGTAMTVAYAIKKGINPINIY